MLSSARGAASAAKQVLTDGTTAKGGWLGEASGCAVELTRSYAIKPCMHC